MRKINTTITEIAVHLEGDSPVFGESATRVRIDDEGGGQFVTIQQETDDFGVQTLRLDYDEVEPLFAVIQLMMKESPKVKEDI